jgi:hypothetical protein
MKNPKQLTMEVDWFDNAGLGWTPADVEGLFEKCARAGIRRMFWSVLTSGWSEYHSRILPLYDGRDKWEGWQKRVECIRSFDALALAVELGRKYGISIIAYFRMFDDYFPGLLEENIDRIPHGWWESRCGKHRLLGWPDYWLPEVRDHKMKLVREIAGYGVRGFLFGLTRSHSLYFNPFRQPHFWGYNKTVADEYLRRYGVDIRKFEMIRAKSISEGPFSVRGLVFENEYEYVGAEKFDLPKWHDLKAEGALTFIRQVRRELGANLHIAIEASHHACPPFAPPLDDFPAKMFFYPGKLVAEGLINEWVACDNWRSANFPYDEVFMTHFKDVLDNGGQITLWLNDILTPLGGGTLQPVGVKETEDYLQHFVTSQVNSAGIHESAFLEQNPNADEIWKVFGHILK